MLAEIGEPLSVRELLTKTHRLQGNVRQTDDRRPRSPFAEVASVDHTEAGMPDGRLLRETPRGESVIQVSVVNDLEQVTALKGSVAQEAWVVLPAGADQQFHGHRRGEAEVPESPSSKSERNSCSDAGCRTREQFRPESDPDSRLSHEIKFLQGTDEGEKLRESGPTEWFDTCRSRDFQATRPDCFSADKILRTSGRICISTSLNVSSHCSLI